jgi:hypothetical protein
VPHPNDPDSRPAGPSRPLDVLPGGETLALDGSTVADPETGLPVPAAVLRLPAWRLRELAATLQFASGVLTLAARHGTHLPTEFDLSTSLAEAGHALAAHRPN